LHPEIARLRAAGVAAAIGNGLTGVVLPLTLASVLEPTAVAVALAGMGIGMMLSFARGGSAADVSNRVHTMVRTDLVRAAMNIIVALGLAGATWAVLPPVALVVIVTIGCLGNGLMAGYFRPAQASLWASLIGRDRLQRELQINSMLNRSGLALGAAAGGILITFDSGIWGFYVDALSFLITAALVRSIVDPRPKAAGTESGLVSRLLENVKRTLRIDREWRQIIVLTRRSTWMRFWFLCSLGASWTAAASTVAAPVVLVADYTSFEAGLFQTIRVFALLAGALLTLVLSRIVLAGFLDAWSGMGSALANLAIGVGMPAAIPTTVSGSAYFAQALSAPSMSTYVGHHFPEDERGRIYAAVQGVSTVLSPLGMLTGAILMAILPPETILTCSAALTLVFCALPLLRRSYWNLAA
jgi:hypothetical protein